MLSAWGPVAGYALLVSVFSHQASIQPPQGSPDWLLHAAEFAILGGLVARGLARAPGGISGSNLAAGAAGCVIFALLDEWHQSFVPGRHASLADVAADAAGAGLALAAVALAAARRGARRDGETEVTLLSRPGCHPCEEAERMIRSELAGTGVRFTKRNVDDDPPLAAAYGLEIPVVLIDGRKRFKLRVDRDRFRRAIQSRTHRGAGR